MFNKFGEFNSYEELNEAAAGLKEEGDEAALLELAEENGIDREEAEDYLDGCVDELCNCSMAALGKIAVESKELEVYEIMEDWIDYIKIQCIENEDMARAVRKSGKTIKNCIAELLKWSFKHQYKVPDEVIKAAGVSGGKCTLGIPGMRRAKDIIRKYYLEG